MLKRESLRDTAATLNGKASDVLKMMMDSYTDDYSDFDDIPEGIKGGGCDPLAFYMLEEQRGRLGGLKVLNERRPGINVSLAYVGLDSPDEETIFYDFVEGGFFAGTAEETIGAKTREGIRWLARARCLLARMNRAMLETSGFYDASGRGKEARERLFAAMDDIGGLWIDTLPGKRGGRGVHYIYLGPHCPTTIFYDSGTDLFAIGDPKGSKSLWPGETDSVTEKGLAQTRRESPFDIFGRQKAETAAILSSIREGDSVSIGDAQYYIYGLSRYFASMFAQSELDALPGCPHGGPIDWKKAAGEPSRLLMAIEGNNLPVTNYYLDLHGFWKAVVTNPLNSKLMAAYDVTVSKAGKPYDPTPDTNGGKYYTAGSRVFLDGGGLYEIKAVGDQNVWYVKARPSQKPGKRAGKIIQRPLSDFDSMFFNNPLNQEAIERAESGEDEANG